MAEPYLESFSREYAIVHNTDIRTWREEEAHMDRGLYNHLTDVFGEPIVGMIDGIHYQFKPSTQVLSQECAIPRRNRASDPSALLVQK